MDIGSLVAQFGLPTGLLLYFIWRDYQTSKDHKADIKDIAITSVKAIDRGTDAINDSVDALKHNTAVISENSHTLNDVKGVLSKRELSNGRDGV